MKSKSYIWLKTSLLLIGGVSMLTSCSLEEDAVDFRRGDQYYNDPQECEVAVKGVYAAAQWIHSKNMFEITEFPADYTRTVKTSEVKNRSLVFYQWDQYHENIRGFYSDAFSAINRFNSVIENISKVTFLKDDVQHRMIAEAKFMRALHYFDMVRIFGEHPVKLTETLNVDNISFAKWKNEEIFKKVIIPDFEYAEKYLTFAPHSSHRVSGAAAKALMARVYLWLASCGENGVLYHDWVASEGLVDTYKNKVKSLCEELMAGEYDLYNNFYDLWLMENKISYQGKKEHIFAINFFNENNEGLSYTGYFNNYYNNAPGWDLTPGRQPICLGKGFNVMGFSEEFYKEIQSNPLDKRSVNMFVLRHGTTAIKNDFIANGGTNDPNNTTGNECTWNTGANCGSVKFRLGNSGLETSGTGSPQMPIVRYADVLLMYAEVCGLNDPNGLEAFAKVRRRAYEDPAYTLASDDFVDEEEYQAAIIEERKIELCLEMSRWFDLVRTKTLGEVVKNLKMKYNTAGGVQTVTFSLDNEEKRMFFPIPSRAIELNSALEQNAPWKN